VADSKTVDIFDQVSNDLNASAGAGASFEAAVAEAQGMGLELSRERSDTKGQYVYTIRNADGKTFTTNVLTQGKRSVRGFMKALAERNAAK